MTFWLSFFRTDGMSMLRLICSQWMMSIQLFSPNFRTQECLDEIKVCLEKGWTGLGFKTIEIEDRWKEYTSLTNAHFLSSNTVGLHLAFHIFKTHYDWQDDDEVITTPLTFISTNHAILQAGLKPVFADIDESLCLCPQSVEARITKKTKAIIFVGIGGNTGQYETIRKICSDNNIILILDAAHMAGSRLNGAHVGYDADCTVFSFQAVKNMPTADSGMICFSDAALDSRARKLSWLGINKDTFSRTSSKESYKWKYDVEELGFKYHGNSIMAAIANVSLKYLDQDNSYRRQLSNWYTDALSNVNSLKIIPVACNCESSRHLFQIRVPERDSVMIKLNEKNIYPGVHYRDNTEYQLYSYAHGSCPNAHLASQEIISLPMHAGVSKIDVDFIASTLKSILSIKL